MQKTIHRFRSNYEKVVCGKLDEQDVPFEYETVNLHYEVSEQRFTTADRKKMLLVIAQHPDKDIRMVFQRHTNKLFKGSKTTYSNWCDKNNIKWADKMIPVDWINEKPK